MSSIATQERCAHQNHARLRIGQRKNPKIVVSNADAANLDRVTTLLKSAKRETNADRLAVNLTEAFRLVRNVTRDYINP